MARPLRRMMACPGDACSCFGCYLCFIYPNLVIYLGLYVYAPCMSSNRFISSQCVIVHKSPGKDSVVCNYIKVEYDDPRGSTESRNIGNLCPNEHSIDDKGWCYTTDTFCYNCTIDCWFNPDNTKEVIEQKLFSRNSFINALFWPHFLLVSPLLIVFVYYCQRGLTKTGKICLPSPVEAVKANRFVSLKIRLALKKFDATDLNNAILEAAQIGRRKCLKTLLNKGAEITAKNVEGNTTLHLAAMRGRLENVETLIRAGSARDINCRNIRLQTAFHLAAMNGFVSCLETLAISGADPYAIDSSHRSAMWYSVSNGHYDATVFFIQSNYYLLTDDNILLPEALQKRHLKIAKALVIAGCRTGPLWGWEVFICDEEWEPEERMQLEWLRNISENPKSLSHLSRLVIRGVMGRRIPKRVKELHLPRILQGYICMDDLLSIQTRDTILDISDRDGDIFWISDC